MSSVTLEQIKSAVEHLKNNSLPPRVVKNKKEAARMNREDRKIGLRNRWKPGDEYYMLVDFSSHRPVRA